MNSSGLKSKDHTGTACRRQEGVRSISLQVKVKQRNKGCASAQGTFEVVLAVHSANNTLCIYLSVCRTSPFHFG